MIPGVNFQPGAQSYGQQQNGQRPQGGSNQGVQEAIKVLSLRLPKVVGARSVAPQALLTSQGSGGNPNIDSIVESVLSRMFPGQGSGAPPSAPMFDPGAGASASAPSQPDVRQLFGNWYGAPNEPTQPQFPGLPQGGASSSRPAPQWRPAPTSPIPHITPTGPPQDSPVVAPPAAPAEQAPDLRQHFDWLPEPPQETYAI